MRLGCDLLYCPTSVKAVDLSVSEVAFTMRKDGLTYSINTLTSSGLMKTLTYSSSLNFS